MAVMVGQWQEKILIMTIQVNLVLIPRDEATQIDLNCH